jgi:hypothetical protein
VRRRIVFWFVGLFVFAGSAIAAGDGTHVFRGPGIVVRYPDGWYVTNEPLNSITDPVLRFVLSSYRLPAGADANANYAPPTRGVIAELVEEVPPINNDGVWRPRPRRFRLPRLGRLETFGGNRWGEVLFRNHGRHFYIFIGVGRRASSAQVALMLRTLDAMAITARR